MIPATHPLGEERMVSVAKIADIFELADRGADRTTETALAAWRIASLATTAEDHALADLARSAATALDAAADQMRAIADKVSAA